MLAQDTRSGNGTNAETAARLRELGISFMPVDGSTKKPSKRHLHNGRWGHLAKRHPTADEIRVWFGDDDIETGIAIISGEISGSLLIRDFDNEISYDRWKAAHEQLAATCPTEKTPHGHHVVVRVASEVPGTRHVGDGELRGDRAYTVCAPTVGEGGEVYEWLIPLDVGIPVVDLEASGLLLRWDAPTRSSTSRATEAIENNIGDSVAHSGDCSVALRGTDSDDVLRAIRESLPNGIGQRNNALFDLARRLRGIPSVACGDLAEVKAIVRLWHSEALPVIRTKDFQQSWSEFGAAWRSVRYPDSNSPADDPIAEACGRGNMFDVERFFTGRRSEQRVWLAAVCWQLQLRVAPRAFFLSATTAARVMGLPEGNVSRAIANRHVRALCDMRLLEVAYRPPRLSGLAYRYRFVAAIESVQRTSQVDTEVAIAA